MIESNRTIPFEPKFAGSSEDIKNAPMWNEKIFGIENKEFTVVDLQVLVAFADAVRVQVGLRGNPPNIDTIFDDQTDNVPPLDVTMALGFVVPVGKEVVVRVAISGGTGPNNTGLLGAFIGIKE